MSIFSDIKTAVSLFKDRDNIAELYKLDKAITQACSIDRTSSGKNTGYSVEPTPKNDGIKICKGKNVRYIMKESNPTNWTMPFILDNEPI